VKLKSQT